MRLRLLYLDDDPSTTSRRIRIRAEEISEYDAHAPLAESEEVLLSTPLRTIVPRQDW